MENVNLLAIFLTGLLTGGLTCMAVQGGLLAATIAQREEERLKEKVTAGNALPILSFLIAKLVSYTILGFLLGWLGSFFQLSIATQVVLQIAVGIFMIGTALSILNVHPIFRYFVIQPPKFLTRMVRKQSKSSDLFAPGLLGALTVFIPCGTTQAMMALAIASGSAFLGAAVLFAFVLGTGPLFFILGYFVTRLGDSLHQRFMRFAAYAIVLLAVFNINNAVALSGSPYTLDEIVRPVFCTFALCNSSAVASARDSSVPVNEETIQFSDAGYWPTNFTVKAGSKVTLKLVNENGQGCVQAFTIPSLGIQRIVQVGSSDVVEFTAPEKPGQLAFMCGMGMYRGVIRVI